MGAQDPPGGPGPREKEAVIMTDKVNGKLAELRNILLEGADYRPIELLDEIMGL